MKKLFLLANALIASSFCPSILANSNHVIPFSPYADLTLNSTWSAPYQDMEPADLAQISEASQINNFHLAFITDAG